MIDLGALRNNPEGFKKAVGRKGYNLDAEAVLTLDTTRRGLIGEIESLRAEANKIAKEVRDRKRGRELKEKIKVKEKELAGVEKQLDERLLEIPNPPFDDVPDGASDENNKILHTWGEKPAFGFDPKDHLALGNALDIFDFEAGAKVAGSQFYYLKNEGAFLELALVHYALDILRKNNFTLLFTPDLARERFYKGTGYLPRGDEAQTYEIEGEDLGLIATAEVTLAAYHADQILDEGKLPIRYAGLSHCFRKEAGAYGKESKGLYRVHQFTKVEMFVFANPEQSRAVHEELLNIEEEIFQGLGIPYRVVEIAAGALGAQAAKKYDLEAWLAGRGEWGEVTSTSNTTDYQARNLDIKYRNARGNEFVHTLNGTAIAVSRAIIAILENFQQKDGGVKIPKALHEYLSFKKIELK